LIEEVAGSDMIKNLKDIANEYGKITFQEKMRRLKIVNLALLWMMGSSSLLCAVVSWTVCKEGMKISVDSLDLTRFHSLRFMLG
jgi:hypothetical protein